MTTVRVLFSVGSPSSRLLLAGPWSRATRAASSVCGLPRQDGRPQTAVAEGCEHPCVSTQDCYAKRLKQLPGEGAFPLRVTLCNSSTHAPQDILARLCQLAKWVKSNNGDVLRDGGFTKRDLVMF